jgi:hypothetical protein
MLPIKSQINSRDRNRHPLKLTSVVLMLLVLAPAIGCSEEVTYVCPPTITVESKVSSLPEGWQTLSSQSSGSSPHYLEYATFTDGHPKMMAYLRPTTESPLTEKGSQKFQNSTFEFSGVSADGIWLVCAYRQTEAIIFMRLPDDKKICVVTSSNQADAPVSKIACGTSHPA